MKIYLYCLVATLLGAAVAWGQVRETPLGRTVAEDGVEVLTRGPVHEAFAETIAFDPEPGVVVAKAAPDPIEELPPEQKPDGANVSWIPGYWAWDDERTDFLWVSGIWRALPPGRQWVPGYWGQSGRGSQWTSGYWADAQASDVEYLPEPPATVEEGPNIAQPSPDHIWAPGCWVWNQTRYAWRPGFWATAQANWVWTPAHYVWSPRGYVFVEGYYDHSVARRGVLFAPVYFNASTYSRQGFSYSPATVINPAVFISHLFLRPSYGHYYFGDYYSSNYSTRGFSPWFSYYSSRYGYDPFYAHQRWHHRNDREWDRGVEADFAHRRDHEEARPPRTWAAQRDRSTQDATNSDKGFVVAASLEDLAKSKENPLRFQQVAKEERQQISQRGLEYRTVREERQKLETEAADPSGGAPVRNVKPVKVKLPRTPIASQPVDRIGKDDAPPQPTAAPQPDATIAPNPRKPRGNVQPPLGKPNVEPKPIPIVEPQPVPKVEPKPERPRVAPQPAPRVEPKPVRPRVEPKPTPRVEPKPTPRVEPQPVPRVEPKPERPRVAPQPAPRVEPKPERPRAERKEEPKRELTEAPRGEGKNKPRN